MHQEVKRQMERDYVGEYVLYYMPNEPSPPAWWWDVLAEYFTA